MKNKIDSQKSILNTEHTQIKFSSLSNQFKKYDKDKLPLISYEQTPEKKEISKNQNINFNRIKYFNSKQELKNQSTFYQNQN